MMMIILFSLQSFFMGPNCAFCELYVDYIKTIPSLIFFCSFAYFDCAEEILTSLKTYFCAPKTYTHQKVRLPIVHFDLVKLFIELSYFKIKMNC